MSLFRRSSETAPIKSLRWPSGDHQVASGGGRQNTGPSAAGATHTLGSRARAIKHAVMAVRASER